VVGDAGVVADGVVAVVGGVVVVSPESSLLPHATASGVNTRAAPIATTPVQRR
jgi:hypothetical protein